MTWYLEGNMKYIFPYTYNTKTYTIIHKHITSYKHTYIRNFSHFLPKYNLKNRVMNQSKPL